MNKEEIYGMLLINAHKGSVSLEVAKKAVDQAYDCGFEQAQRSTGEAIKVLFGRR